jgi:RNA polymerase sigma-70 factor (ECF subfamily)
MTPCAKSEESSLIERALKRDTVAMRLLIDQHRDRLFAFVWRMLRDHHDAEEVCQEAFLRAFAALASFDPKYRFSTWLFTIAYRLTLNALRRKKPLAGDIDFSRVASECEAADEVSANSEEARRLTTLVWDAVDQLSTPQRATILLFYKQQKSCHEIAQVLDIPVATVKSHLHRARIRLKSMLESELTEENGGARILMGFAG